MVSRHVSTVGWVTSFLQSKSEDDYAEQSKDSVVSAFRRAAARSSTKRNKQSKDSQSSKSLPPINILSMDGGGARGWALMPIYGALEEAFGKDNNGEALVNVFDLMAGTSVGGTAALMLHRYPKRGDAVKMGKEMFRPILEESFSPQEFGKSLQVGHFYKDTRGDVCKKYYGEDTPLKGNDSNDVDQKKNMKGGETKEKVLGPKVFAVSSRQTKNEDTAVSSSPLEAFLLRTYDQPKGFLGIEPVPGTSSIKMWQAGEATSAQPVFWDRTRARRQSVQEDVRLADGCLVANNPTRHAIHEASMLFPGRPLGVVISVGLGRYEGSGPDTYCEDLAEQVAQAGGKFIRINPLIDNSMGSLTTDAAILDRMEQDVIRYMATSEEAQRAKRVLNECLEENPSIRGRYVSVSEADMQKDKDDDDHDDDDDDKHNNNNDQATENAVATTNDDDSHIIIKTNKQ